MNHTSSFFGRWMQPRRAWPLAVVALLLAVFWIGRRTAPTVIETNTVEAPADTDADAMNEDVGATRLWAHNLLLSKGPHFRVYVRWIRGRMLRTARSRIPSFDATDSFVLSIEKGVIDVKLSDLAEYLNSGQQGKPPLQSLQVENHDGEIQFQGMAHKLVPIPVRLDGDLTPLPDGRLKFHLKKLHVLKLPMKGLFGAFHVELSDLMPKNPNPGVQLAGNDVYFDTTRLLPPPHIKGRITSVQLMDDHIRVIYGGAAPSEETLSQWHNFLRLSGGGVSFGKLTMQQADLTLIDATDDAWFGLDLANYQTQLVYGTMHVTEQAGVEAYMPDLDRLTPAQKKAAQGVTLGWLKNRNAAPPLDALPTK